MDTYGAGSFPEASPPVVVDPQHTDLTAQRTELTLPDLQMDSLDLLAADSTAQQAVLPAAVEEYASPVVAAVGPEFPEGGQPLRCRRQSRQRDSLVLGPMPWFDLCDGYELN